MSMTFSPKIVFAAAVTVLLCFACPHPGLAATFTVAVNDDFFSPSNTTVSVNDEVVWAWGSDGLTPHTTSNTNGLWDSGTNTAPFSFTNQFTSAGTFPYECRIHVISHGMRGNIIVTAPNVPPAVSITNPASGTVLAAPANVTIQASASDTDGTVTNVQFLIGSTVLANDTVAPYSAATNNLAAGSYTFSAIASDNGGATATNTITISVVNPSPVLLSVPALLPVANFQFSFTANTGLSYVVQRSTNLLLDNWIPLATNLAGGSSVTFTDINATVNPAFYRVGRLPNP
jgi:plastocyanin